MEIFIFKNVSFAYPEQNKKALNDLSFSIKKGSFNIICGPSGCGKSTLLRHFKTTLSPHGVLSGEILYKGKRLCEVSDKTQAQSIGFVLQSPDNQIVTDKVWHELAFGLESLGMDTPTIRRRVAEMASFFGIENWFYKNVTELSGGQKQLLSLASVMAMQPEVLVLDEPTSQLDPIAANEFLSILGKINREIGTTIVLTEHRLEEAFPFADNVFVMENGSMLCQGTPKEVGKFLKEKNHGMFFAMPTAMRVWFGISSSLPCPVTIRDGSEFLTELSKEKLPCAIPQKTPFTYSDEVVLKADEIRFKYEKDLPDVLKSFSILLKKGELFALLGGNGTGKTTALKVLAGICEAYSGKLYTNGKAALLTQNPQSLFVKKTVYEDLMHALSARKLSKDEKEKEIAYVSSLCRIEELLQRHPYDISGGEQQRCALAKTLLTNPDILLLDEPTKGFDAEFKFTFAQILKELQASGVTILMVSHDVAFCAEYADRCGLFFDGSIVTEGTSREFFSGNSFYTTPANRMARHILKEAVTVSDIITAFGGTNKTPSITIKKLEKPTAKKEEEKPIEAKKKKLPLWRKLAAFFCAIVALSVFVYAISVTDLSSLISSSGLASASTSTFWMYGILTLSLLGFILSIGRRSKPPISQKSAKEKSKLKKRTKAAAFMILLLIPLTIFIGVFYLGGKHYNSIALLVLLECMLPFFLVFEGRKPKARELVTIAVLCAVAVASRAAFFMLPQFKPMLALTIIVGVALGAESGFLVGAISMLVSNILFSQGPWTPWQMFAMGIIGFLSGILFKKGLLARTRLSLSVFGALSAVIIYGGIMNFASAVMWNSAALNSKMLLAYYVSGFPMDLIHAAATVVCLMLIAEPMLEKLDRIKTKYGLVE